MTQIKRIFAGLERRLGFLPFSPFFFLIQVLVKKLHLNPNVAKVCFARLPARNTIDMPRDVLVWLAAQGRNDPTQRLDACFQITSDDSCVALPDVFSVMMTCSHVQSTMFDFSEDQVDLDGRLPKHELQPKSRYHASVDIPDGFEKCYLEKMFLSDLTDVVSLPVSAKREASQLLKRLAGAAKVVCFNLFVTAIDPEKFAMAQRQFLFDAKREFPDMVFLVFDGKYAPSLKGLSLGSNVYFVDSYGLTLYERMALVGSADLYVGAFDLLAVAALSVDCDLLLFGDDVLGGNELVDVVPVSRRPRALWYRCQTGEDVFGKITSMLN